MIIATGKSRKDTRWHNAEMTWEELVDRLREPYRTRETFSEYKAMSKEEKGQAKDVGGFVGGRLNGGHRKKGAVEYRQLVTLDLDNAAPDAWDNVAMWGWTCCCYSTHSHCESTPRLRVLLPLDRAVTAEEYEPLSRKIAEYIGIEQLDRTTYEPERLMFWPSCSSDGDWFFREQTGDLVCADDILAEYGLDDAWKDTRLWPTAKEEATVIVKESKRQGDPREKPGIVGLFNRTYTIPEAMDAFLPGVYVPTDNGRYTYTAGSTAAGAVLYNDDTFIFSHHSTDPCGGHLCNAFDMVRLHLFGDADGELVEDTPVTKLSSYMKMCELASDDPETKRTMTAERQQEAVEHFKDLLEDVAEDTEPETDPDWAAKLTVNRKTGECDPLIQNAYLILKNDAQLAGKIRYNLFKADIVVTGDLPWKKMPRGTKERGWTDHDDAEMRRYMEVAWKFKSRTGLEDAIVGVSHSLGYDPLVTYLTGLQWDGVERLDDVLIRHFGAEDTDYTRAVTRKWFVAAVRRAFEPGCKFDTLLVLHGAQGVGKSQFGKILAGDWFTDSLQRVDNKDSYDALQGVWIVELAEMSATRKAENEQIKSFISKRSDRYRKAYDRRTTEYPRHCVFVGTTNTDDIIKDETGGRRFWPVPLSAKRDDVVERMAQFEAERDQLWAEAVVRYRSGEKTYEDTQELLAAAQEMQARYTQEDEMLGQLEAWLETLLPDDFESLGARDRVEYFRGADLTRPLGHGTRTRDCVSVAEIRAEMMDQDLMRDPGGPNNADCRHLGRLMATMPGWTKGGQKRTIYGKQQCYFRDDAWDKVNGQWVRKKEGRE